MHTHVHVHVSFLTLLYLPLCRYQSHDTIIETEASSQLIFSTDQKEVSAQFP